MQLMTNVRICESTAIECLKKFVTNVILIFENEYLQKSNSNDVQRLLKMGEDHRFPGMLGSIDCMHWQWNKMSYSMEKNVHD